MVCMPQKVFSLSHFFGGGGEYLSPLVFGEFGTPKQYNRTCNACAGPNRKDPSKSSR